MFGDVDTLTKLRRQALHLEGGNRGRRGVTGHGSPVWVHCVVCDLGLARGEMRGIPSLAHPSKALTKGTPAMRDVLAGTLMDNPGLPRIHPTAPALRRRGGASAMTP